MANVVQRSFAGGEIAPALYARTDQTKYATGLRTMRNFLAMRHGGAANRPGTSFVAETKGSGAVRLIPFVYAPDPAQVYVLEFGNLYLRFHQQGAPLAITPLPGAWVGGGFNYDPGSAVLRLGVYYYAIQGSGGFYGPSQDPSTSPLYWYPLTGTIMEIPTTYTAAELDGIQVVQDADVMTIVHQAHKPRELRRLANFYWTLTDVNLADPIGVPQGPVTIVGGAAHPTLFTYYAITAVGTITGQEGEKVTGSLALTIPTAAAPMTVSWVGPPGVLGGITTYRIYRSVDGATWGLVGAVDGATLTFLDAGITPDYDQEPPAYPGTLFGTADNYPGVVGYYQQRRLFANTINNPERVWMSRPALPSDFHKSTVIADDDPIEFSLRGRQVNEVRHLLDLARLLLFAAAGEWTLGGDGESVVTPTALNPQQQLYHGASRLAPLVIGHVALYVQARGSSVRDLVADSIQNFQGAELSLFAAHLFDGYQLVDWCYQQIPHSIVWAVRSDGTMLGLTYLREQEILAWHRHDTDGVIERVCTVPEDPEDAVYLVVRRTIGGVAKRYIERLASRVITPVTDPRDLFFVDSGLTYDGRNTDGAKTVTLTSSPDWTVASPVQVDASSAIFAGSNVNDELQLFATDGRTELLRLRITVVDSAVRVHAIPSADVPVTLQGATTRWWALAVDTFLGLAHLEGKAVAVVGDARVVASPNNATYDTVTVTGGQITLAAPAAVVHVGLPYLCDLETLDIDTPSGPSLKEHRLLISAATLELNESWSVFVGARFPTGVDPLERLDEVKLREASDEYGPLALRTAAVDVTIQRHWDSNGRLAVRAADPGPVSIVAIIPRGTLSRGL